MSDRDKEILAWAIFIAALVIGVVAAGGFYLWEFLDHVGDEAL